MSIEERARYECDDRDDDERGVLEVFHAGNGDWYATIPYAESKTALAKGVGFSPCVRFRTSGGDHPFAAILAIAILYDVGHGNLDDAEWRAEALHNALKPKNRGIENRWPEVDPRGDAEFLREILLSLAYQVPLSDHLGHVSGALDRAFALAGMELPARDDGKGGDGFFDIEALEARGAKPIHELRRGRNLLPNSGHIDVAAVRRLREKMTVDKGKLMAAEQFAASAAYETFIGELSELLPPERTSDGEHGEHG